ncbi:type II toxin-antitoxin system VapC family toxin [Xanthomonas sacchari]|uniref:type II toxin-antitoxin system VapC family toxin n=1 Tax=Xanthomonas sacchari TaxID=56458 RepID=UPI002253F18A|nr:type II toxin-antitoxin system VapC family toxin [Xanthomonas sacchari]
MTARKGLLIDTSALIAFVQPTNVHHENAKAYIEAAIRDDVPLYISSLTLAEFCGRQDFSSIDTKTFIPVGFESPEGVLAAKFDSQLKRQSGDDRVALKIDVMLIAHAEQLGLAGILTCDGASLAKYCERLNSAGLCQVLPIVTAEPFVPAKIHDPSVRSLFQAVGASH